MRNHECKTSTSLAVTSCVACMADFFMQSLFKIVVESSSATYVHTLRGIQVQVHVYML